MTPFTIDYLADHLDWAPLLGAWHHREWRALMPDWSLAEAIAELASHTGRRMIPTTLVAVRDGEPLGSVSLLLEDLPELRPYSPWLASLYVLPAARGAGIGRALARRAMQDAAALGVTELFLFSAGQQGFYQKLGWTRRAEFDCHGQPASVMSIDLRIAGE
ncbi:MAG: GNAT family N-acetyltransferase [Gammaproteobacteria bacterium]